MQFLKNIIGFVGLVAICIVGYAFYEEYSQSDVCKELFHKMRQEAKKERDGGRNLKAVLYEMQIENLMSWRKELREETCKNMLKDDKFMQ